LSSNAPAHRITTVQDCSNKEEKIVILKFRFICAFVGIVSILFLEARTVSGNEGLSGTAPSIVEEVVQRQVDAYNRKDMPAFLALYSDEIQVFEHPSKLVAEGKAELEKRYAARFAEPDLHAEITGRMVSGNVVVDHENVRRNFPEGAGFLDAIAIYRIESGKIAKVWLILGPKTIDVRAEKSH
jgi:hypothetical protein